MTSKTLNILNSSEQKGARKDNGEKDRQSEETMGYVIYKNYVFDILPLFRPVPGGKVRLT